MSGLVYTCENCKKVFESDWSDEEARAEAEQWGDELAEQGEAVLCDDCYQRFMEWARKEGLA